jgi:hypothetical protein
MCPHTALWLRNSFPQKGQASAAAAEDAARPPTWLLFATAGHVLAALP